MKRIVLAVLAVILLAGCYEVKNTTNTTVVNNYYSDSNSVLTVKSSEADPNQCSKDPNQYINQYATVSFHVSFEDRNSSSKRRRQTEDLMPLILRAQAEKVSRIYCYFYDHDNSRRYDFYINDDDRDKEIEIEIGNYKIFAFAYSIIEDSNCCLFTGEDAIEINKGYNEKTIVLSLEPYQPIVIDLPQDESTEECIAANCKRDEDADFIAYFCPLSGGNRLLGTIPIDLKELTLLYNNKTYILDFNTIMNSILFNEIILLEELIASIKTSFDFAEDNKMTIGTKGIVLAFKIKAIGNASINFFKFKLIGENDIEEIYLSDNKELIGASVFENNISKIETPIEMLDGEEKTFILEALISASATPENSFSIELIEVDTANAIELKQIHLHIIIPIPLETLQVAKSDEVATAHIAIADDQYLGAYEFTCAGGKINISSVDLIVDATEDAVQNVKLVDPEGNIVAGPTDPDSDTGIVHWSDNFVVPVGKTVYKVKGDLRAAAFWTNNDTVHVSLTPSAMIAVGEITNSDIIAAPNTPVLGNVQIVKAGKLTVTRNSLPTDNIVLVNQKDVILSSWNFDATESGEDIRITSILWTGQGAASVNTEALTTFVDVNENGVWDKDIDTIFYPVEDCISSPPSMVTFAFEEPIVIPKKTSIHVALKGDKNSVETVEPNNTENWGLTDASISVIAYGKETGDTIAEYLIADKGPTLTSINQGALTVDVVSNLASTIVVAESTNNTVAHFEFRAQDESADLEQFTIYVTGGDYDCAETGDYKDISMASVYDDNDLLTQFSIPSTNSYTVNFSPETFIIPILPAGYLQRELIVKVDMSAINPEIDDAPGTANASFKIGISDIRARGLISNNNVIVTEKTTTGKTMVLHNSNLNIVCSCSNDFPSYNPLGAATSLTNGLICVYATKIHAYDGKDGLIYKLTYEAETNVEISNPHVEDQYGNIISKGEWTFSDDKYTVSFYLDNPDFESGLEREAIEIPNDDRTFYLYTTVSKASTEDSYLSIRSARDDACKPMNTAEAAEGNFIWSDNYKELLISNREDNAVNAKQWYNGTFLYPPMDYYGWYRIVY